MKSAIAKLLLVTTIFTLVIACDKDDPTKGKQGGGDPEPEWSLHRGLDSICMMPQGVLSEKILTYYYYIPASGDIDTMKILFVIHGTNRNATDYLNYCKKASEKKGFIIIAPCFSKGAFPNLDFQFGGVSHSTEYYDPRPQNTWTYNIIENIFDDFVKISGSKATKYDIWGHSAGGQFVHRMSVFMNNTRIDRAVASNPGSYTFVDPNGISSSTGAIGYPYSVMDMKPTRDDFAAMFSKKVYIHLGTADLETDVTKDPNLPHTPGALAQGDCRFRRGHNFYDNAKHIADSLNLTFNWKLVEVSGVAHNGNLMFNNSTSGAATVLY